MNHWTKFDVDAIKEFKESMEKGVKTIYFKSPEDLITPA